LAVQETPSKGFINWHIPIIKSLRSSTKFEFKCHLSWVKGHAQVPGNEAVDACAKFASLSGLFPSPKNFLALTYGKGPSYGPETQLRTTSSTTETIYPTTLKLGLSKEQKIRYFS
jgi:hypothetical protein